MAIICIRSHIRRLKFLV